MALQIPWNALCIATRVASWLQHLRSLNAWRSSVCLQRVEIETVDRLDNTGEKTLTGYYRYVFSWDIGRKWRRDSVAHLVAGVRVRYRVKLYTRGNDVRDSDVVANYGTMLNVNLVIILSRHSPAYTHFTASAGRSRVFGGDAGWRAFGKIDLLKRHFAGRMIPGVVLLFSPCYSHKSRRQAIITVAQRDGR